MGRELRMVPKNWEHPKNENGRYIPLLDGNFAQELADWEEGEQKWKEGFREKWGGESEGSRWQKIDISEKDTTWEEWTGEKPNIDEYMPQWDEKEKTHFQMYENTSEGSPISPVMDSPEKLAKWLVENNASAFGSMTATYERWMNTINRGYAPSAVSINGKLMSGVEGT